MNRKPSLTRAWYPVFLQVGAFAVLCAGGSIADNHQTAATVLILTAVILGV